MQANRDLQTRMRERLNEVVEMLCFIRNINKVELAKKVGVSRVTMHNFLTRKTYSMKYDTILEIFKVLQFDIVDAISISNKNCTRPIKLALILKEILGEGR